MGKPEEGEWLSSNVEPGQTFEQYINGSPTLPTKDRRTIYVQPLGRFTAEEANAVALASEFIGRFFGLPVKTLGPQDFDWPLGGGNQRYNRSLRVRQVRTGYILHEILEPRLPADAAALIAFTTEDLYPDESMNFVFGQATLEKRVGVWSLARLRDDDRFRFMTRVLKVGIHETGHMFSIYHCTKFYCVMSGSNHIIERDSQPLDACPECTAKICWMTDLDPAERFESLKAIAGRVGLDEESRLFELKRIAVEEKQTR